MLEDVPGDSPDLPWSSEDVAAVTRTLGILARTVADPVLPALSDVALALTAWDDVASDPAGIDRHVLALLPEMLDHQARAQAVTRGDALVHWDARSDNVLLCDGDAVLVDWAWACRGAPWLDTLLLAVDLRIQGGPDADAYLTDAEATREADPADLRAMVACMVGFWSDRARRPDPPGLPTIRQWQAHCAAGALSWFHEGRLWR